MVRAGSEVIRCLETARVCALTSVHPSTLDYWVRTRLVTPSLRKEPGRRRSRLWTIEDMIVVRMVHELRKAGCPLQRIRAAKRFLAEHGAALKSSSVLFWDGTDVFRIGPWGDVESTLVRPGQQVLHVVALPVGVWGREGKQVAKFIRADRLRTGVPCDSDREAREAV
jgi:DNA-binding transcriptional MerR regulator